MNKKTFVLMIAAFVCGSGIVRADFKYTESSKITGGMAASMMKIAGAFSKQAREPIVTTHYVKGNKMRTDRAGGETEILDVAGRRMIHIDSQKKTYSIVSFDEIRAAMEKAQQQLQEKGAKLTPKAEVTPTGNTRTILGQPTREVKVKLEMEMKGQDPQTGKEANVTMIVTSNMWIAPSVAGYGEFRRFYESMGKELSWQPRAAFGGDPQMAQAMAELQKNAAALEGMPLLQYATIGMPGVAGPAGGAGEAAPAQPETITEEQVSSPGGAIKKGLGGLLGGFGRKKKQQEQQPQPAAAPSPAAQPGVASLAEVTTEVTAFSSDPLDSSLFEVPAGYKQVPSDVEKLLKGAR